jgi:hypothetical protein
MKYKTYKELVEAYEIGELDRDKNKLIMDNDCCHVYVDNFPVFEGNGYYDMDKLLDLLGIPNEEV